MLTINPIRSNTEYLADAEETLKGTLAESKAFDNKLFNDYLKDNKLEFTKANFEKYLNNNSSHYEARVNTSIKEIYGIEKYNRDMYVKLMSNQTPIDKEKLPVNLQALVKNNDGDLIVKKGNSKKIGVDVVGSAPKGLSILFAVSDNATRDKIANAMFETTNNQIQEMAKQVLPSSAGVSDKYQDFDPEKTKLFATLYLHPEGRPDGNLKKLGATDEELLKTIDPLVHIHGHISNTALFYFYKRDDNGNKIKNGDGSYQYEERFLAIDNQNCFKSQLQNSAQFDVMLRSEVEKAGIKTYNSQIDDGEGKLHNTFGIVGISHEEELKLSNRSKEIYKTLEQSGKTKKDQAYKKGIEKNTKATKLDNLSADQLRNVLSNNTYNVLGNDILQKIEKAQQQATQQFEKVDWNKFLLDNPTLNNDGFIKTENLKTSITRLLMSERAFNNTNELRSAVDNKINELMQQESNNINSLLAIKNNKNEVVGYTRLSNAIYERAYIKNLKTLASNKNSRTPEQQKAELQFFKKFLDDAKANGIIYNKAQLQVMKQSLTLGYESGSVLSTIGDPGSGKSSSIIKFQNALWEFRHGQGKVFGISTANIATRELSGSGLQKQKLKNSMALIQMAYKRNEKGEYILNPKFINDPKNRNNLYILEEYGMFSSEHAHLILQLAKHTNSKVSLIGDHKQLSAVNYGKPMDIAIQQLNKIDTKLVQKLDIILRQKNQRGLDIVKYYENGQADKLFKLLEEEKALTIKNTDKNLLIAVANDYLTDGNKTNEKIITCKDNKTIDRLNKTIREKVKSQNLDPSINFNNEYTITVARQGRDVDILSKKEFAVGERIIFLKGVKETKNGKPVKNGWSIDNSQLAIIEDIKKGSAGSFDITVNVDGKSIKFNTAKDTNHFNLSYCCSTHKSQGQTKLMSYRIGNGDTKNQAFVGGSRHTGTKDTEDSKGELGYKLYLTQKNVETYKKTITKSEEKFSTIDNKDCDNAVKKYSAKILKTNYEVPKEVLEQRINKDEFLQNAVVINKQIFENAKKELDQRKALELESQDKQQEEQRIKNLEKQNKEQAQRDKEEKLLDAKLYHSTLRKIRDGSIVDSDLTPYLDGSHKFSRDVFLTLAQKQPILIENSKWANDKQFILDAIKKNPNVFFVASDRLKEDLDIGRIAIEFDPKIVEEYFSISLKEKHKEVISKIIKPKDIPKPTIKNKENLVKEIDDARIKQDRQQQEIKDQLYKKNNPKVLKKGGLKL